METALSIIFFVVALGVLIVMLAGMWKTFEKAGESGWKALIPIYNIYIMCRISGHSGWWLLIFLLPVAVIVVAAIIVNSTEVFSGSSVDQMITALNTVGVLVNFFFVSLQLAAIVGSVITYDLSRSFGKGLGFTLGLSVLGFIFWPILGFGKATYRGPVAHPKMVAAGSGAHIQDGEVADVADEPREDENDDNSSPHHESHSQEE